uniref:DH domain-containing protein n=1 Tax=Macrostomum lignano TaxID=282301 RepID=A0A1I8F7U2_9PLAT
HPRPSLTRCSLGRLNSAVSASLLQVPLASACRELLERLRANLAYCSIRNAGCRGERGAQERRRAASWELNVEVLPRKHRHWRELVERGVRLGREALPPPWSSSSSSSTAASIRRGLGRGGISAAAELRTRSSGLPAGKTVWELFKSELNFLIDYLMVLKHVSELLEPDSGAISHRVLFRAVLKKLQVDGHLMFVEPEDLFGNIDELCYWNSDLQRRRSVHSYCLNYHCAVTYLDILRRHEQFAEFEKVRVLIDVASRVLGCLSIADLLVAPMQHCTKMPLLLASIRRYTVRTAAGALLTENLRRVENSLKSLEDKLKWLRNFERLQTIQQQLIWPPITELETRVFIPEFSRAALSQSAVREAHRHPEEAAALSDGELGRYSVSPTEGALLVVHRQPIRLDRFSIHDIGLRLKPTFSDIPAASYKTCLLPSKFNCAQMKLNKFWPLKAKLLQFRPGVGNTP